MDVEKKWKRNKRWATWNSRAVKLRIAISLIVGFFASFFAGSATFVFLSLLVFFALVLAMRWRYTSALKAVDKSKFLKDLDVNQIPRLREIVDHVCPRMGIESKTIRFMLASRRYDTAPSVIAKDGMAVLCVPLGFLKLLTSDPEQADAILAHELAHIAQNDTNLWLLAESFLFGIKYVLVPANSITLIALLMWLSQLDLPEAYGPFDPYGHISYEVHNGIAQCVIQVLIPFAFYSNVRYRRRRSEELADMAAVAFSSGQGLLRALTPYIHSSTSHSFSTHGSATSRIKKILKLGVVPNEQLQTALNQEQWFA